MNDRQEVPREGASRPAATGRWSGSLRRTSPRWSGPALAAALSACAAGPDVPAEATGESAAVIAGADIVRAHYELRLTEGRATGSVELELAMPDGDATARSVVTRSVSMQPGEGHGRWLPQGADATDRALVSVHTADGPVVRTWRSPRALPLGAVDPRAFIGVTSGTGTGSGDEARAAFVRFCESLLLLRDPMGGAPVPGGVARAWFGGAVASRPEGTGGVEPLRLVPTLADLCVELFSQADEPAARALVGLGWHTRSRDADWAVPRWLALRDQVGDDAFREVLRSLVDAHAGGEAIGLTEIAESFASDETQDYVRAWLAGPARPSVETSWRHDASRARILLRVDQVHEVTPGVPAAYPFSLPIVIVTEEGGTLSSVVDVRLRRDLIELPCEDTPLAVRIDPEATLAGRVDLEADAGA